MTDLQRLMEAARALLKAGPEAEEDSDAEMDLEELLDELEAKYPPQGGNF